MIQKKTMQGAVSCASDSRHGTFSELLDAAQREGEQEQAPVFEEERTGPEGPGLMDMVMCTMAAIHEMQKNVRGLTDCVHEMALEIQRLREHNRRLEEQVVQLTDRSKREENVMDCLCSRVDKMHRT